MKRLSRYMHLSTPAAGLLASAVVIPMLLVDTGDAVFPNILYFALVCPLVFLVVLVLAFSRRRWNLLAIAGLYVVISVACFDGRLFLRYHERWFTHREPYLSQVLAQPKDKNGLQHVSWDDWGGFGAPPTVTYLVHDSNRTLSRRELKNEGAVPGVPCDVWQVHRLAAEWYSITFYTGSFWEDCRD